MAPKYNSNITLSIIKIEAYHATKDLEIHKLAGQDSISTKWFQESWNKIGGNVKDVVLDMPTTERLHLSLKYGLYKISQRQVYKLHSITNNPS